MKQGPVKYLVGAVACVVIVVVGLLVLDRVIASGNLDPTAAAQAAVEAGRSNPETIQLKGYESSGGMFGSTAVVTFFASEIENDVIQVSLKRPFLSKEWKVVMVERARE